jgi:glycosyltransferase involved in cell wall biosynthesis
LPAALADLGVRPVRWPACRAVGPVTAAETSRLGRIVERLQPDLVHLHSAKAGLAGRLAVRGRRPTVFQPHAWSFLAATGLQRPTALAWERYATRWTHRTVFVSERERSDGIRYGVHAPGVVVRNGVDVDWFRPADDAARAAARGRLGLAAGPTAVCVGRICRQKGQDVLLAAWPSIRAAVPGAVLALVGDGPAAGSLAASAPPGVVFAGPVADPRPWYAAADVVVQPSRWEGMALTQLEAMACARCVVATDVGGARELLPDDSSSALVPAGDITRLVTAMVTRLSCPALAAREGAAARARACAAFDRRRMAAAVRTVYADLVRSG